MVYCPVHNKYLNGRNDKSNHAHDEKHPCKWMQDYIYKTIKNRVGAKK